MVCPTAASLPPASSTGLKRFDDSTPTHHRGDAQAKTVAANLQSPERAGFREGRCGNEVRGNELIHACGTITAVHLATQVQAGLSKRARESARNRLLRVCP